VSSRLLTPLGAQIGSTALHYACAAYHAPVVELLLQRGADAAVRNKAGRTPRDVVGTACTAARLAAVLKALQTGTSCAHADCCGLAY
jgi:hypothetical protein